VNTAPLWERLLVAGTGAAITVIFGTLIVGIFLQKRTTRDEDRRQFGLRQDLVQEMTRITITTKMAIVIYKGERRRADATPTASRTKLGEEQLDKLRVNLDELYSKYRGDAGAMDHRLRAHFDLKELCRQWHSLVDLLTVRYHNACELDAEAMRNANAGDEHSGLSIQQLGDDEIIDKSIDRALEHATRIVLKEELTGMAASQRWWKRAWRKLRVTDVTRRG
jgi:hypothetical protein